MQHGQIRFVQIAPDPHPRQVRNPVQHVAGIDQLPAHDVLLDHRAGDGRSQSKLPERGVRIRRDERLDPVVAQSEQLQPFAGGGGRGLRGGKLIPGGQIIGLAADLAFVKLLLAFEGLPGQVEPGTGFEKARLGLAELRRTERSPARRRLRPGRPDSFEPAPRARRRPRRSPPPASDPDRPHPSDSVSSSNRGSVRTGQVSTSPCAVAGEIFATPASYRHSSQSMIATSCSQRSLLQFLQTQRLSRFMSGMLAFILGLGRLGAVRIADLVLRRRIGVDVRLPGQTDKQHRKSPTKTINDTMTCTSLFFIRVLP